jgi:threonine dehydrogenase-like Zn-dependent dehydrogenase
MKYCAISITAKEQAELVNVDAPGALGPNEVRGRTLCTLISPGTELAWNYLGTSFPSFPGYAATFVAEELGSEVKNITIGNVYFCMGSHRSFQQVDAQTASPVPDGLPPEEAVLARLMGVSMTTLMTTTARPGDRVMVTGAGPVGFLAAQILKLSGYEVLIVEPNEARRQLAEQAGICRTFDKIPVEDASIAGTVALVVECSGHEQAVLDACRMVRRRGEVVLVGVPWRRQTDTYAHELLSIIFHKYAILRSGWEWELPRQATDFAPHSIHAGFNTALRWLAAGQINIDNLITKAHPSASQSVYQDLLHHRTKELFSVFDWSQSVKSSDNLK